MIDDCWHLATTAKGKHEWMILSHSPKMSQIYVANFCEDICTACRGVSMALAFQKHLMHNNHNGTHIVMHWKTWKQKTSLSAPKALSQGMFPVKNCVSGAQNGVVLVQQFCRGASALSKKTQKLGASRRHFAWPWKIRAADSFAAQFWQSQKIFVARVWQSIFELGVFLKQILEQCVRLSYVSSQETSMRFRRVGLQRDKNDKKNLSSIKKTKSSWAPLHLVEMCRISRWIFFSRIVDQENQEGDDAKNAEFFNLNKEKQKKRLEHVVCRFARKEIVFLQIVQQSNNI